ncbi:hypothetical protein BS17DRAFT_773370 [Gyrodon lividus]|nr:hypothetical protein BS17DRAFT_773370 [Gyrodon lividus]
MSDASKQERIEELLRKSLLGEELINTQFHLFSARSVSSGRVVNPRVLCANNVLLIKSSKYFLDLLASKTMLFDPSLIHVADNDEVPSSTQIDDYGYESDSDLDNEEPPAVVGTETTKELKDDDEFFDDDSESASSEMFVSDSEEGPRSHEVLLVNRENSVMGTETTIQAPSRPPSKSASKSASVNGTATRLRSLGSHHLLIKDTAFQTWYTLLNYLYTGKVKFLPPRSSGTQSPRSSTSTKDEPRCSAKSMYRLACKVGLDDLRDAAFASMQNNITEQNILRELSCSLISRNPPLLEMALDTLYSHIASPRIVAGLPALARRIANKELPHGADIIIGLHMRMLKEHHPLALITPPPQVLTPVVAPPNFLVYAAEVAYDPPPRENGLGGQDFDSVGTPPPPSDASSLFAPISSGEDERRKSTLLRGGGGGGGGAKKKKKK